jgi:hypothetical protein
MAACTKSVLSYVKTTLDTGDRFRRKKIGILVQKKGRHGEKGISWHVSCTMDYHHISIGAAPKAIRNWQVLLNELHTNEITRSVKSDHARI